MKLKWFSVVLALCVVILGGLAFAEEKPYELNISVGGSINDFDEKANRAAEFKSQVDKNSTWYLSGEGRVVNKDFLLRFNGTYIDGDEQDYGMNLDFKRLFSVKSDYHRFYHRLDHDHLSNLFAHSYGYKGGGSATYNTAYPAPGVASASVYAEDFSQGVDFGITRSQWKNNLIIRLPSLPGLRIGFDYRYEKRKGFDQARTLSKCSACHVVGMTKHIAEFTNEYLPYLEARLGNWTFKYSFLYRDFRSSSDIPTTTFLNAQGPAADEAVGFAPGHGFGTRVLYDYNQGALPFARTPESEKWMHSIKAKWDRNAYQTFTFGFVTSEAQNTSTDEGAGLLFGNYGTELEQQYSAGMASLSWRINHNLSLSAKVKYYTMDADDLSLSYVNSAGNQLYRPLSDDDTPYDPAEFFTYNRESAYDEDGFSLLVDLAWRFRKDLKFHFGYELEYEDRNNAEYHDVTDSTTTHEFKVGATWRGIPKLKIKADYKFVYVDDPKMHYGAADPAFAKDPTPTNFADDNADLANGLFNRTFAPAGVWTESSIYEYLVYGRRTKDFSAEPETVHDLALKGNWSINPKASLAFHGKIKISENSDTDGYDWEHDVYAFGLNLTLTPLTKIGLNLGYEYYFDETTAMLCSALYHG